jgi:hypothetical protein
MAASGVLGNGTKVAFAYTSPAFWMPLAQLQDVPQFIDLVANDVDITVQKPDRIMTSMPGMIPPPEIKLVCLEDLDPVTCMSQELARVFQEYGTNLSWRVEVPTDRTVTTFRAFEFQGYIREWTPRCAQVTISQILNLSIKFGGALVIYDPGPSQIDMSVTTGPNIWDLDWLTWDTETHTWDTV